MTTTSNPVGPIAHAEALWFLTGLGYSRRVAETIATEIERSDDADLTDSESIRAWLRTHGDQWRKDLG
ncbi:hypothetical protein [Nocardia sp. NPDC003963]